MIIECGTLMPGSFQGFDSHTRVLDGMYSSESFCLLACDGSVVQSIYRVKAGKSSSHTRPPCLNYGRSTVPPSAVTHSLTQ